MGLESEAIQFRSYSAGCDQTAKVLAPVCDSRRGRGGVAGGENVVRSQRSGRRERKHIPGGTKNTLRPTCLQVSITRKPIHFEFTVDHSFKTGWGCEGPRGHHSL